VQPGHCSECTGRRTDGYSTICRPLRPPLPLPRTDGQCRAGSWRADRRQFRRPRRRVHRPGGGAGPPGGHRHQPQPAGGRVAPGQPSVLRALHRGRLARGPARGHPGSLAWFSPTCTHFSKAKGAGLLDRKIRGLAWVAVRWAALVRPRIIVLENVEEFQTWGPLTADGRPDKRQAGRTFRSFLNALRAQGYEVEYRELKACDYGAPTIRKRLFLIARADGLPIVWPAQTHAAPADPRVQARPVAATGRSRRPASSRAESHWYRRPCGASPGASSASC
jgi:C-5 cytosine-specific DNA methylase